MDNRDLHTHLFKLAAKGLLRKGKEKGILPGIFAVLHTFGRDLKQNVHIHLSSTCGGLTDSGEWKKLTFHAHSLMKQWRHAIVSLLRKHRDTLKLPSELMSKKALEAFFSKEYDKHWHVWVSPPEKNHRRHINYLGRYLKRPPIALSRILYANHEKVVFKYYDHTTRQHRRFVCTPEAFTERLLQHVPEKGFQMIRYFGFLANRVRSKLLPKVYKALNLAPKIPRQITFAELMQASWGDHPYACLKCKTEMTCVRQIRGRSLSGLYQYYGKAYQRWQFLQV